MSPILSYPESHPSQHRSLLRADGPRLLRALLAPLVRWQDRWRQRCDLQALSAAQLADIGLTRDQVPGWTGTAAS